MLCRKVALINSPLLLSEGARLGGVLPKKGGRIIEGFIECRSALMSFQNTDLQPHYHIYICVCIY